MDTFGSHLLLSTRTEFLQMRLGCTVAIAAQASPAYSKKQEGVAARSMGHGYSTLLLGWIFRL